jgi:hypothetical protein
MLRVLALAGAVLSALTLTACSNSRTSGVKVSVFNVKVGECFKAPTEVQAQLSKLSRVPCDREHDREIYSLVDYKAPSGNTSDVYPGADLLNTYSKGICAQEYKPYVGVDYLDSSLFFTYLYPSARSWEQDDDRSIICFVRSTGAPLTGTVKGSMK